MNIYTTLRMSIHKFLLGVLFVGVLGIGSLSLSPSAFAATAVSADTYPHCALPPMKIVNNGDIYISHCIVAALEQGVPVANLVSFFPLKGAFPEFVKVAAFQLNEFKYMDDICGDHGIVLAGSSSYTVASPICIPGTGVLLINNPTD